MLGRQPAGRGRVHRVPGADRLVVGHLAEVRLAREQRPEVQVAHDRERRGVGRPVRAVAELGVAPAHDRLDVAIRSPAPATRPVTNTDRSVHRDLDADERPRLAADGELHDRVRDGVADLVGVPGCDRLGRPEPGAVGPSRDRSCSCLHLQRVVAPDEGREVVGDRAAV